MWVVSEMFLSSDGARAVTDRDAPEDVNRLVWVFPQTKPKKGCGWNHQDVYRDELAQKIANFLNKEKA